MTLDSTSPNLSDWFQHLEASGYRLTEPRRVVAKVVAESRHTLSPIEVYDLARQQYPKIGLVTVYRTLEKLEELELISRVHQVNGCNGYIAAPLGHQHLLICQGCGRIEYFSGDDLVDLVSKVEVQSGYTIESHWLQLSGHCTNCQH